MTTLEFNRTEAPHRTTHVDVSADVHETTDDHDEPHRRRNWIANIVLIIVCVVAALSALGSMTGHWRTETVLSGSMRPGIQPGDVEILRPEPASSLRVGQIVAFHPPKDHFTVTHRVMSIQRRTGSHAGLWITTKGDANNADDPWGSIRLLGSTVWTVRAVIPDVGFLSTWLKSPILHLVLVLSIVLLVCSLALRMIWRS